MVSKLPDRTHHTIAIPVRTRRLSLSLSLFASRRHCHKAKYGPGHQPTHPFKLFYATRDKVRRDRAEMALKSRSHDILMGEMAVLVKGYRHERIRLHEVNRTLIQKLAEHENQVETRSTQQATNVAVNVGLISYRRRHRPLPMVNAVVRPNYGRTVPA